MPNLEKYKDLDIEYLDDTLWNMQWITVSTMLQFQHMDKEFIAEHGLDQVLATKIRLVTDAFFEAMKTEDADFYWRRIDVIVDSYEGVPKTVREHRTMTAFRRRDYDACTEQKNKICSQLVADYPKKLQDYLSSTEDRM